MKILFMCVANSARSQIAEGLAMHMLRDKVEIRSAGSKPTKINPFAIDVLNEVGADSQNLYSKSIEDLPKEFVEDLNYVITLCAEEVCPVLISKAKKLHWPLPDPAGQIGNDKEQLKRFRLTREQIKECLQIFIKEIGLQK